MQAKRNPRNESRRWRDGVQPLPALAKPVTVA